MDTAVIANRKARTYAVTQCRATLFRKRHAISGRRCLTAEERCPVIVKVLEYGRDVNCSNFDHVEPRVLKKICQMVRVTQRKSPALIERDGVGVQGYRRIPEATHHLHLAGVVPCVGRDDTATPRHPLHFTDSIRRIGNEIYHQARYRGVGGTVGNRNVLRIADLEGCARVGHFLTGKSDKAVGGIDPRHAPWRGVVKDLLAQRTRAATDIKPVSAWRYIEPCEELAGDEAAPSPDIGLVRFTAGPYILALDCHGVVPSRFAKATS